MTIHDMYCCGSRACKPLPSRHIGRGNKWRDHKRNGDVLLMACDSGDEYYGVGQPGHDQQPLTTDAGAQKNSDAFKECYCEVVYRFLGTGSHIWAALGYTSSNPPL